MVGSALLWRLARDNCEVLTVDRGEADLTRQADVEQWMEGARPGPIFICAAKVGGILANDTNPVPFLYDNLAIATNVIHAAANNGVIRGSANPGECAADRTARTYQRVVCDRQDCGT